MFRNTGELIREADIAISRSGQVWIAADKIYCWDEMTGRLVDYGSATPFRCNALTADVNGKKKYHNFEELLETNDIWEVK